MKNKKIILDYDNTIVDSIKAIIKIYNRMIEKYNKENWTNLKMVKLGNLKTYDFHELADLDILGTSIKEMFESEEFFKEISFFDYAKENIDRLHAEGFDIKICTVGSNKNIELKKKWLKTNLPFLNIEKDIIIVLDDEEKDYNKSLVNMQDSIFVDDKVINLSRISEFEKTLPKERQRIGILFKYQTIRFEWQENWQGYESFCWNEVYNLIHMINQID